MAAEPKIKVTKLDAAIRQLRTAIRIWFQDGDPVSIHTLFAASHEIIHTLFRRQGFSDLIFDSTRIKDELRGEWARRLKEAPNFFKHARDDVEGEIEFSPSINSVLMLTLAGALQRMGVPEGAEEAALSRWLLVHEPQLFFQDAVDAVPVHLANQVKAMDKKEFFESLDFLWKHRAAGGGTG